MQHLFDAIEEQPLNQKHRPIHFYFCMLMEMVELPDLLNTQDCRSILPSFAAPCLCSYRCLLRAPPTSLVVHPPSCLCSTRLVLHPSCLCARSVLLVLVQVLAARTANKPRAARPGPRFMAGSAADERELMCADLEQKRVPRRYGETPDALKCGSCVSKGSRAGCCSNGGEGTADRNWYECIAPSPLLTKLSRLKKRS
eukprot:1159123-Pelagomonas_calceolata.AAC.3